MMRTCDRTPLGCRGLCASERRKSRDLPGTMRRHTVMNRPINSASSYRHQPDRPRAPLVDVSLAILPGYGSSSNAVATNRP